MQPDLAVSIRPPRAAAGLAALSALLLLALPVQAATAPPGPDGREMQLRSCVAGSPPLRMAVSAERAALDARDRLRFQDAAQARYPLYQRGGLSPTQVLMLRRGGQWQYVTLREDGRGGPCFTAVFAAERFDFTAGWLAKYKPRAGEADD
jgi:hypothetical protein